MKNIHFWQSWNSWKLAKILAWKFCMVALAIVGIHACTDHENISDDTEVRIDKPISMRSLTTTADRVYFADYEEFEEYYMELDSILYSNTGDYFDSIVDLTTGVQTLNDVIAATAGTFGTVSDPVMRAIVNTNCEFQIDDYLITIISDGQWLVSDVANNTLKNAIRGVTKGAPLAIGAIPEGALWTSPDGLGEFIKIILCGCWIKIEPVDCETIRVFGACRGWFGSNGGGIVEAIYWPDQGNSFTVIDNEEVDNNFEFLIPISEFNNVAGGLVATADSDCETEFEVGEAAFNFDPDDFGQCDKEAAALEETIGTAAERMVCRTAYIPGPVWHTHLAQLKAETWNGSSWTRRSSNLTVEVEANRKSIACSVLESKDDDENCGSCSYKIVRVNWTFGPIFHCDGDLVGRFTKVRGAVTLNRVQEPDFDCCE